MSAPRVHVSFWRKPIPTDRFDYIATYDGYEGGDGYDEQPGPTGEGATAAQAVLDLIDNHPRGVQCARDIVPPADIAHITDREPIHKDGIPGWIVEWDTTICDGDFATAVMIDGRRTSIRYACGSPGPRVTHRVEERAP